MPYLLVRVDPDTFRPAAIGELRATLEEHAGGTPVVVAVRSRRLLLAARFNVAPSPTLDAAIRRAGGRAELHDEPVPHA